MKQVIQNFKTGDLSVDDVPPPSLSQGMVLVENHFSLISAGTERGTVKVAQSNLLNKARQRPDLVAQVMQNIKKEGVVATFNKVKSKLETLKALGYSCSGVVLASMDDKGMFKPGDRVACAGVDYASHAEIVSVPQNLVVKIPDNVDSKDAAFTTLGAIAMQGLRQADPKIGEKICVIGLGLLGQITTQLLRSSGCRVLGIDLSPTFISIAKEHSVDEAILRNDPDLVNKCDNFTNGRGFDAVIITAATNSNDPITLAGELARKKGKVVVVGVVPMDIPRDPHYYRKELDIKMSCSYGPGRYDVEYENNGNDYPYSYVRWTEQRNMESFLDMLAANRLNLLPLTTHIINITEAKDAYDIILGKVKEHHIGILLQYSVNKGKYESIVELARKPVSIINTGFIGAGSFAQSYLIPNVKSLGCSLDTVVTSRGITSRSVASKFGFNNCSSDINDIINNKSINTVFIATPHSFHAKQVEDALRAGKNVFVEKPLALNIEELNEVKEAMKSSSLTLMVGFNRRFAPVCTKIKEEFIGISEPKIINIRINAGFIPKDNWLQQPNLGGGRVIGEMCHFIDLMQYFTGSVPVKVYGECIQSDNDRITPADNISIIIKFKDGSVGNLCYVANGDKGLPKEHIEVFGGSKVGIIDDFQEGAIYKNGKRIKIKSSGKGHREEIQLFIEAIKSGMQSPIGFHSIYLTTLTTFAIHDCLSTGLPQEIAFGEEKFRKA